MKLSAFLPVVALSLLSISPVKADAPHLTSVTQPLYYGGSVAGPEIQPMSVPKIFESIEAEFLLMLYMSPTIIEGSKNDLNLISAYGIKVRAEELHPNGALKKVVVDISKATKPEDYPFSIEEAALATVEAIRMDMKDGIAEVILVDGDKVLPTVKEAK